MKKKLIILMILVLSIIVCGCSNIVETSDKSEGINLQYEEAMSNGKSSVIEEEYDKAIDYFKLALESKEDDTEAKNLIEQIHLWLEILTLEVDDTSDAYFEQMLIIDEINDIKTDTDVVKNKVNNYKELVLSNIETSINSFEEKIDEGKYKTAQKNLESAIEKCKKSDSLKEQLDRCNKLLETCKEKKKEAEEQAKKQAEQTQQMASNSNGSSKKSSNENNSEKVYCNWGHYTDKKNMLDDMSICVGCFIKREFSSTSTYEDCPVCGNNWTVSQYSGECYKCGAKVHSAVKEIYDDGTIIYEDGSRG